MSEQANKKQILRDRALQIQAGVLAGGTGVLADLILQQGWQGLLIAGAATGALAYYAPEYAPGIKERIAICKERIEEMRIALPYALRMRTPIDISDEAIEEHARSMGLDIEDEQITEAIVEDGISLQYDVVSNTEQRSNAIFPDYRPDETLRIGQAIDKEALAKLISAHQKREKAPVVIGSRFEPHINSFFGKGVILAAAQGSGKSMLNGLIIEQAGSCDVPVIIFDHKGEYAPIVELSYLNGLIAGGEQAQRKATKIGASYFHLTIENAQHFVAKVFAEHCQAVIMLPSYGDSWVARAEIVAAVGQALMGYAAQRRAEEKVVLPCLVFLDEAQLYIPQNAELLPPEARENRRVLNALSNAFFALVSNGRSNGYTMCFATQSLTYIAKWAIKSSQIKVLMRHVEYNDLNMCEEIIGSRGVATREDMETMPPGVGVVFGFTPKPMIVQFDRRESRDESETPGIERLRAHVEREVHTDELELTTVTVSSQNGPSEHENEARKTYGYGRNGGHETASEEAVRGQNEAVTTVTMPDGWTEKKAALVPGLYRVFGDLDDCLKGLEFSTSQKNRDFAREILKQQGLWKEK